MWVEEQAGSLAGPNTTPVPELPPFRIFPPSTQSTGQHASAPEHGERCAHPLKRLISRQIIGLCFSAQAGLHPTTYPTL